MIWWCEEHECAGFTGYDYCYLFAEQEHDEGATESCRMMEALLIVKGNGEWSDDAYERISERLQRMGGTEQWKNPSYRIAYAKLCMDALAGIPLTPVTLPGDALASIRGDSQ